MDKSHLCCFIRLFQIILFQVSILFHNTFPCHLGTWMLPCLKRASSAARTTSNTWKTSFCFCHKLLTKSFREVRFPPACLSHLICWLKSKMVLTDNQNMVQWKTLGKYITFWQKNSHGALQWRWWAGADHLMCKWVACWLSGLCTSYTFRKYVVYSKSWKKHCKGLHRLSRVTLRLTIYHQYQSNPWLATLENRS